ncbi:MAG: hypothetical protein QOG79_2988 [Mycobacterium sp.]|jgi:hypothetical protein|nr:hypothetical protein [Mycobacterium sp.]MDT5290206.1 hypothetical protein [Mycobacterium sp.]MDT5299746.1 hypothetical protein [Mycobacterium sp.]
MTIRAHRVVAAGALAVAAVAAPIAISLSIGNAAQSVAGPACLAWYGNKEDGVCLSYSNGNGVNLGSPDLGVYGPNSGTMPGGGIGVSTGPLLPGQTWNVPVG